MTRAPIHRQAPALAATLLLWAASAEAEDAVVQIKTSTFNKLASAVEPINLSGRHKLTVGSGRLKTTICDSAWSAKLKDIKFTIKPSGLDLTGEVSASWCHLSFNANLKTNGNVLYSASQSAVVVTATSSTVQPKFTVSAFGESLTVTLPVHIDIATPFNLPPIPVNSALLTIETATGDRPIRVTPQNVSLSKLDGAVELRGNLGLR